MFEVHGYSLLREEYMRTANEKNKIVSEGLRFFTKKNHPAQVVLLASFKDRNPSLV
jgi:hypothetical protein